MPIAPVNDINLYYEIHGEPTRPPLVMIMGMGMNTRSWASLLAHFSQAHCCIIFDNRGSGRSDVPAVPFSMETLADDVAHLMDFLSLTKAHVLGVSMGSMVAIEFALKYPDRLNGLILVSAGPRLLRRVGLAYQVGFALRQARQMELATLQDMLWLMDETFFEDESKVKSFKRMWRQVFSLISLAGYEAQMKASLAFDARSRLSRIQAPTLIIHGNDDKTMPLSCFQQLVKGIPQAASRRHDGGHLFFLTNGLAKEFAADAITFLATLDQRVISPESF